MMLVPDPVRDSSARLLNTKQKQQQHHQKHHDDGNSNNNYNIGTSSNINIRINMN